MYNHCKITQLKVDTQHISLLSLGGKVSFHSYRNVCIYSRECT